MTCYSSYILKHQHFKTHHHFNYSFTGGGGNVAHEMITWIATYHPASKVLRQRERDHDQEIHQLFYLERGYSRIGRPCNMEPDLAGSNLGSSTFRGIAGSLASLHFILLFGITKDNGSICHIQVVIGIKRVNVLQVLQTTGHRQCCARTC